MTNTIRWVLFSNDQIVSVKELDPGKYYRLDIRLPTHVGNEYGLEFSINVAFDYDKNNQVCAAVFAAAEDMTARTANPPIFKWIKESGMYFRQDGAWHSVHTTKAALPVLSLRGSAVIIHLNPAINFMNAAIDMVEPGRHSSILDKIEKCIPRVDDTVELQQEGEWDLV